MVYASTVSLREQLGALAGLPDRGLDLGAAAAMIARVEYPELDPFSVVATLDAIADQVRDHVNDGDEPLERLAAVCGFVYGDLGFVGNTRNYYDPRNSYLNDVLERRTGIPITLSVVLMEVARRVGITLRGVTFPGHFIMRYDGQDPTFVDPFGGTFMDEDGCRKLLERLSKGTLPFKASHLSPVGSRAILLRLIRNLKGIALKGGDVPRTLDLVELSLAVEADQPRERRDRGLLSLATGSLRVAVDELQGYLDGWPEAPDRVPVRERLHEARRRLYAIN